MSLSRSPSPRQGGGWSSPGLIDNFDHATSQSPSEYNNLNGSASSDVAWAAAKARSHRVRNAPGFTTRNEGFFSRQRRKIFATLPRFNSLNADPRDRSADKLRVGKSGAEGERRLPRLKTLIGNLLRKFKLPILMLLTILMTTLIWSKTDVTSYYRTTASLGGGSKFVMLLASNQGGGVMEWKGPREWAIEGESVANKQKYAAKWGYELEIVDMSTKKRYAHEWRESWEKVDAIRNGLKKYPHAEWFWWLDLNTFIMEPSMSLQSHIFNDLAESTYRDINIYNPLGITHPPVQDYLDANSLSPVGDNRSESINLVIPQDCGGFTLGSFFVRRSHWTERLLDIWWDPVCYEQRHMQWEHKEQDALEYIYNTQPWVRPHTAFVPQRKVNSYPPGACQSEDGELDPRFHYDEKDRDFMVSMAGCEWGRDCWEEIRKYRELSDSLNRNPWEKLKDGVSSGWKSFKESWTEVAEPSSEEAEQPS